MFKHHADTAVILGAGFASYAHIPMTAEIAKNLLSDECNGPIDRAITGALKEFLSGVFDWSSPSPLPSLEDLFTMIDLSADSGHNLGARFTPKILRAFRRMLIYRVFTMLNRSYRESPEIQTLLAAHLPTAGPIRTHFIVLNWDLALERHIDRYADLAVDHCVEATPWENQAQSVGRQVAVIKVHGSSNWVYCDNCRTLFYDRFRKVSLDIQADFLKADLRLCEEVFGVKDFSRFADARSEAKCQLCEGAVGPHLATFSYRKSFRTHAFASSWLAAEQLLTQARKWIFIGYSLPDADYEFKHLLKTCRLKGIKGAASQKTIEVVLFNDPTAEVKYRTFFGIGPENISQNGLADYVGHRKECGLADQP